MARQSLMVVGALCLLTGLAKSGDSLDELRELRVRASEAFAPCLEPALAAFTRATGVAAVLDVGDPDASGVADVVVGDDSELTRLLEGGAADLATAIDLGYIPWVFVVPPGSSGDLAAAAAAADHVMILGGTVAREARASIGGTLTRRVRLSRDRQQLRSATFALVPRSLAGPGQMHPTGVRPLIAVAAALRDSPNPSSARALLAFFKSTRGRGALSSCLAAPSSPGSTNTTNADQSSAPVYAASVVDWWLPRCTLEHNGYNDPNQVLGPPDAVALGGKDQFLGFMSLGQGGYVTVDMGVVVMDGPGADIRVFQMVSGEPVTLYASATPRGPFRRVGLMVPCGERRSGDGNLHHCDFDLRDAGLTEARYFKIEDGEIFPCLKGNTISEGPDIDAIQVLSPIP